MKTTQFRKSILFIIDEFQGFGGTERHLFNLVRSIQEFHDCHIIAFHTLDSFRDRIRREGIHLIHVPLGSIYTPLVFSPLLEICKFIRKYRVTVVQTFHYKSDVLGVIAAKATGVPLIISSRRDMGFKKGTFERVICRCLNVGVHRFITVSDAVARCIERSEGVPVSKVVTIYNGIDSRDYRTQSGSVPLAVRQELGIGDGQFVIGIVGHVRPEKNYGMLFEALDRVHAVIDDFKVLIVGYASEDEMRPYTRYSEERGFRDHVVHVGYVDNAMGFIGVFDISCLVSKTEGFSNAILEYMYMGKPVIATDVGGNREIVEDGSNGFLIPENDSGILAERILELYRDRDRIRSMGENCRRLIETKFTADRMVRAHLDLYDSA